MIAICQNNNDVNCLKANLIKKNNWWWSYFIYYVKYNFQNLNKWNWILIDNNYRWVVESIRIIQSITGWNNSYKLKERKKSNKKSSNVWVDE
jgi:hypothetical protein